MLNTALFDTYEDNQVFEYKFLYLVLSLGSYTEKKNPQPIVIIF